MFFTYYCYRSICTELHACVCFVCVTAGLDVDRVCREVDIQALQQNISNVTFCDIGSEASGPIHHSMCWCTQSLPVGLPWSGWKLY